MEQIELPLDHDFVVTVVQESHVTVRATSADDVRRRIMAAGGLRPGMKLQSIVRVDLIKGDEDSPDTPNPPRPPRNRPPWGTLGGGSMKPMPPLVDVVAKIA